MLIERNREDIVYGGLRRINYAITGRLAVDSPLPATLTCIVMSWVIGLLIIATTQTLSVFTTRNLTVSTI